MGPSATIIVEDDVENCGYMESFGYHKETILQNCSRKSHKMTCRYKFCGA